MEELNKKNLYQIFLGFLFFQAFALLALSANFLLAQTNTADTATTSLTISFYEDYSVSAISGTKTIYAVPNKEVGSVKFNVVPSSGGIGILFYGEKETSSNKYYLNWDTITFANGSYMLMATAYGTSASEIAETKLNNVQINNASIVPTFTINAGMDMVTASGQTISGTKSMWAKSVSSDPISVLNSLDFMLKKTSDNSYIHIATATTTDYKNWSGSWNSANIADGNYDFFAEGKYKKTDGTYENYKSGFININVSNIAAATPLSAEFVDVPPLPLAGDKKIQIKTNIEPTSVKFEVKGAKYMSFPAIKIDANNYYFLWKTSEFPDSDYLVYAFIEKGTEKIDRYTKTSVNNSTAITTPAAPIVITFIEKFTPPLSGDQKISISADREIYNCVFKIEGPKFMEMTGIKDSLTQCHILLRASDFPNGDYVIRAIAGKDSLFGENKFSARIENQISPAIKPAPTELAPTTEPAPIDTAFISQECRDKGLLIIEDCKQYLFLPFECREKDIRNREECGKFMMENFMPEECKKEGIADKQECDYMLRNTYNSFETTNKIETVPFNDFAYTEEKLPYECQEKEIINHEECGRYLNSINMPEECRAENAATKEECEKIIFKKNGPQECVQAEIFNPQECEKLMFKKYAPDDCREAGIINPEACKKYMFEKYNGGENIPADKFPIECKKTNAKTVEECEKIMQKTYMPQECKEQKIDNEKECETYLQQKYMAKECQQAGARTREDCDKIMFKKFGHPECQKAGIEDEEECEEFMFNKYAMKIECGGDIESWQCKDSIKERHLGNVVAKQIKFGKINEQKNEIVGKSMKASGLDIDIFDEEIFPINKKDAKIKILAANENMFLDEKDNLVQTAPIAFMIDSDEDGLPDDMEKRLGTDPFNFDTDQDGYNDEEEIKNGFNPLGEGIFAGELKPIERAIMEGKPLGHPAMEGEEVESFSIQNVKNIQNEQSNLNEGYVLSGKAEPNSVATLYIYSDLPAVITVDVDQYGNWLYKLDQSLVEGEHEVYVAINDDTGKVVKKSKPLNFFVKEASAISVKDFVSKANASSEEPGKSETSISNYLLIAIAMAIFGIFLFLAVIISRKKNQPLS